MDFARTAHVRFGQERRLTRKRRTVPVVSVEHDVVRTPTPCGRITDYNPGIVRWLRRRPGGVSARSACNQETKGFGV